MVKGKVRQTSSPTRDRTSNYGLEDRGYIHLTTGPKYHRWDSNPYCTDFKSVVSAYWTTVAHTSIIVSISTLSRAIFRERAIFAGCYIKNDGLSLEKTKRSNLAGCYINYDGASWGWTHVHLDACTPELPYT